MTCRRGPLGALLAAAALLLVGGCSVEGTLTVESAQRIGVDVTVRDIARTTCESYAEARELGLQVTAVDGPGVGCHFGGTLSPSELGQANLLLVDAGEHLSVGIYPLGMGSTVDPDTVANLSLFDLRVVFPGPVLRATGTVTGNEARFTREDLLEGGLTAVGQGHAGPPFWVLALGAGLLAGGAAGAAIGWVAWRRRGNPPDGEAPEADDDPFPEDPLESPTRAPAAARVEVDDSVWAPPDR